MKPISANLQTHLASEVTTLATCWKMTRRDTTVLGFTSHDQDIVYDSVTYSSSSGFVPTSVASNSELSVDNMEIEGIIDGTVIIEDDIRAGIYDYAAIEIFLINYEDTTMDTLELRNGWIGEVTYGKGRFSAEVRGLMQSLAQNIGELYSPSCRAQLGDAKCGINIASFTVTSTLTAVTSNQIFTDSTRAEADGYFNMGKITFTSGNNNGLSMEVKEFSGGLIILVFPMPYTVAASDAYSMHAGCDKSLDTCIAKFSNAVNFRGEPHIPGTDAMFKTAGTR